MSSEDDGNDDTSISNAAATGPGTSDGYTSITEPEIPQNMTDNYFNDTTDWGEIAEADENSSEYEETFVDEFDN